MNEYLRQCPICHIMHDTGYQDTQTGEMLERLDKCKNCFMNELWEKCQKNWSKAKIDVIWTKEDLDEWVMNKQ